jgi:hypothetical protein
MPASRFRTTQSHRCPSRLLPRPRSVPVSPLASTLTKLASATPLASTLTKKGGGRGPGNLHVQLPTSDLQSPLANLFRLTRFRKNASANPLLSHGSKTKDLKRPRIIRLQKKGGGRGAFRLSTVVCGPAHESRITSSRFGPRTGIPASWAGRCRDAGDSGSSTLNCGLWTSLTAMRETRFPGHTSNPLGRHVPGQRGWL